jgi:hypothetical protein
MNITLVLLKYLNHPETGRLIQFPALDKRIIPSLHHTMTGIYTMPSVIHHTYMAIKHWRKATLAVCCIFK